MLQTRRPVGLGSGCDWILELGSEVPGSQSEKENRIGSIVLTVPWDRASQPSSPQGTQEMHKTSGDGRQGCSLPPGDGRPEGQNGAVSPVLGKDPMKGSGGLMLRKAEIFQAWLQMVIFPRSPI